MNTKWRHATHFSSTESGKPSVENLPNIYFSIESLFITWCFTRAAGLSSFFKQCQFLMCSEFLSAVGLCCRLLQCCIMFKTLSVRVYVCEATAAYNLSPFMCVGAYTYLRMCVDVTRSPEGRDKTIDFTFGLLPCREAGKLTHPLCVCMQVREREREGGGTVRNGKRDPNKTRTETCQLVCCLISSLLSHCSRPFCPATASDFFLPILMKYWEISESHANWMLSGFVNKQMDTLQAGMWKHHIKYVTVICY